MKRLCSALLCLALGCASLAGCSTQEPAPAPSPSASPEVSQVEETYEIGLVHLWAAWRSGAAMKAR